MNHNDPIVVNGRVIHYDGPIIWSSNTAGVQAAHLELTERPLSYAAAYEAATLVRRGEIVRLPGAVLVPEAGGNKVLAITPAQDRFATKAADLVRRTTIELRNRN